MAPCLLSWIFNLVLKKKLTGPTSTPPGNVFNSKTHFEKYTLVSGVTLAKQQLGTIRPIIVKLRSAIAASGILRKTGKLKRNDSTKSVYICPDRTLMQRKEHRECVEELRRRCRDDTEKSHSIRDGVVVSVTKENSSGEKG